MVEEILLYAPTQNPFLMFTVEAGEHVTEAVLDRFGFALTHFGQTEIRFRRWVRVPGLWKGKFVFFVELDITLLDDEEEIHESASALMDQLFAVVKKREDSDSEIVVSRVWRCFPPGVRRALRLQAADSRYGSTRIKS